VIPRWLRTTLHLTPIVALSSAARVVGLLLWRGVAPASSLIAAMDGLGNYLQTVGAIYAVLLAFVVFVVWGQYNDVRVYIEQEASALVDLHRTASGLPADARAAIQTALADYVEAVLRVEWVAMAKHDEIEIEEVGHLLDQVWLAIHKCKPFGCAQEAMYSEALSRFNDVTDLRTSRLTSARFRVPLPMKILLYTGAVILIGSMYLVYIQDFWLHALVTAALAGAIAHILYLIHDLDDVFRGNLQVDKAPFVRARASFDRVLRLIPVQPDE
jgi:hypothetical protein